MKVHYFQRYHTPENVATANTMLLLSRLYSYSSEKFFQLLKTEYFSNNFEPELIFNLQEKNKESIPDATITQESFKIVVETKMWDWFKKDQLFRHLRAFKNEQHKVLITIAPELMEENKRKEFEENLIKYNEEQNIPVIHVNTTFEKLANAVSEVIDERDYEMQDVLEDYINYCYSDALITVSDSWKWMRSQLAGTTFDFNVKYGLYYDGIDRGFRPHDYIGLYKEKSVKAIGKITDIITTVTEEDGSLTFNLERGELNDDKKNAILFAINDAKKYGYKLDNIRYFFVEKFYETDFKKITPRAPMGTRVFNLAEILDVEELPEVSKIAEDLKKNTWS